MKKILFIILLLIPFIVKAEANVELTNVEKGEQSNTAIINAEPTYEGLKINFDFKFTTVGDYVKYKVTIKNNSDKDYEVDMGSVFSEGEYIEYAFSLPEGDNEVLKSTESKDVYLTIKYNKKVPPEKYVDGAYIEQNTMSINLSNDSIHASVDPASQKNPKTSAGNVLIFITILLISGIILTIAIKANKKMILPVLLLLIPLTIHALEKITIDVEAKIEIENIYAKAKLEYCYHENGEYTKGPTIIDYEIGMTLEEFLNTDYASVLPEVVRRNLAGTIDEDSIYYYDNNYETCLSENDDDFSACEDYSIKYTDKQFVLKPSSEGYYELSVCK